MSAQSDENVTPVFGLSKAQLWPIVESIAGEPVASFHVTVEHQVKGHLGYGARKVMPTFAYVTASGHEAKATVFAKWFHEPGPREAHHYAYLERHRAPIPRMYGSLTGPDQREIVFLEHLDPVDDLHPFRRSFGNPGYLQQFLGVAARFNAIKPCEEYAAQLTRREFDRQLTGAASDLDSIWDHACKGELGDCLEKLCAGSRDKLLALQMLGGQLAEPVAQMETGLAHNDFYPDSTGWRRETGELLMLDLESVGFAPRFFDVARWLGGPHVVQPRCRPRRELARYYLEEYSRWGGCPVPADQFLAEVRLLWAAGTLTMLWFGLHRAVDGKVDWTEDRDEGRRVFREGLLRDLSALLSRAS